MTTIKDVARHAGVSFKTVSRVINAEASVAPEMRARVEAAIAALDYRPTLAARQLAGRRSYTIALVMPRAGVSYVARMMIALAAEARAQGYHLQTEVLDYDGKLRPISTRLSFPVRPDCVIVIPPFSDNAEVIAAIEGMDLPLVRVAAMQPGYGRCIMVDDTEISRRLVAHLVELGHRRIAMIAPPLPVKPSETRIAGYHAALADAGIGPDPRLLVRGDFGFASGARVAAAWFDAPDPPTAIFAASDDMALGAMAEAHRRGLSVPGDVAIAGYDDAMQSRTVFPPLTTVYQPVARIAEAAIATALGREASLDFGPELRLRGSTTGSRELCLDSFVF